MTELQLLALEFVRERRATVGFSPTITEIGTHLDTTASRASDVVNALVRMGKLTRQPGHSRSLEIAGVPDLRLVDSGALRAELARRGETLDALQAPDVPNYRRRGVSCAADSCNMAVKRGHLFCRKHWFDLPEDLRDMILVAFRAQDVENYQTLVSRARDLIDIGIAA